MSSKILKIEPWLEPDMITGWFKLIANEDFSSKYTTLVDSLNVNDKDRIIHHYCFSDEPNVTKLRPITGYDENEVTIIIEFLFDLVKNYDGDVLRAWKEKADLKSSCPDEYRGTLTKVLKFLTSEIVKSALKDTQGLEDTLNKLQVLKNNFSRFQSEIGQNRIFRLLHPQMVKKIQATCDKLNKIEGQYSSLATLVQSCRTRMNIFINETKVEGNIEDAIKGIYVADKQVSQDLILSILLKEAAELRKEYTSAIN